MAMLRFAENITAGRPIDLYNQGKLSRDFTYIADIVDGFVLAFKKPMGYEVINLGNGSPIALVDFVELLEHALGQTAQKNFLPMQPGDVYETYADTGKAKQLLGFSAKTSFADGIHEFVDWFRSYTR